MSLTVHINSLPDLVLRRIFSKVPLTDLLHTGNVCPLWKYYQVETGKQVRSLSLLIGPTAQSLITHSCFTLKYRDLLLNDDGKTMFSSQHLHKWFHVTYGSFSLDCAVNLLNIFPHITALEIVIQFAVGQFHLLELKPIIPLLVQWSPILKSLKIYLQFNHPTYFESIVLKHSVIIESNELPNLLDVINSMQSLGHLTFDTDTSICPFLRKLTPAPRAPPDNASMMHKHQYLMNTQQHLFHNSIDLPILGRLREFYFKSNDKIDFIEKSLQRYAMPNDNLKQIGLDCSRPDSENFYSRIRPLASKIIYLPLDVWVVRSPQVLAILKPFNSITKLNVFTLNENVDSLTSTALNFVSSLPQLTHLHLNDYYKDFLTPIQISRQLLPQLASVQVLSIEIIFEQTVFESKYWAHLFPNVQVIEVLIYISRYYFSYSEQQLREILFPFSQCPKLHHLYTCEKYFHYSSGIEHTLPEMLKEWIFLQVRDRKIIIQVEK